MRRSFAADEIDFFLEEASKTISSLLPKEFDDCSVIFTDKCYLLDHINFITAISKKRGTYNEALFQMNLKHLWYVLGSKRDYSKAKIILNGLKNEVGCLKHEKELCQATLLLMEATHYSWSSGNHKQSIQLAVEAEKLLKNYRFTYENIIKCWRLAQDYSIIGCVDNMLRYVNESEEILPKTSFKAHTFRLPIEQCRTIMYMNQGKLTEAIKSVGKRETINALQTPGITRGIGRVFILKDKSRILSKMGEYKQLKAIAYEISDILSRYYNKKTCLTPIPHMIMAEYYLHSGNLSKAEHEIMQSLRLYNSTLKISGLLKAVLYKIQGDIFYCQHKYRKAFGRYLEAEKIYDSTLVNKKVSDVSELYAALVDVNIKLLASQQACNYRDKHIAIFGGADQCSMRLCCKIEEAEYEPGKG